tara:strand:- start:1147 stop:1515 length:369 start_codon:yes stop_codon:yes gene_type:complete
MSKMNTRRKSWLKKRVRTKKSLGVLGQYPRLIVYKSNKHFYSQLIDDNKSITLCSSSSNDKDLLKNLKGENKTNISIKVGHSIAEKISDKKIKKVIFDRNGYKYHGRIKGFVEAVKEKGIKV